MEVTRQIVLFAITSVSLYRVFVIDYTVCLVRLGLLDDHYSITVFIMCRLFLDKVLIVLGIEFCI